MWFDDSRKSPYELLRTARQRRFGLEVLERELGPIIQTPIYARKRDVDCAARAGELDPVELARLDLPPEGGSRTAEYVAGFCLIYQLHAASLDSSHYSRPVLGCSLSTTEGASPSE